MKLIVNNFHLIFIVLSINTVKGFTMVKIDDKKKLLEKFKNITRYDYNLTIMKSPKPATDNRFQN